MAIEKDIVSYLLNQDDIAALVGDRVYPMHLLEGTQLPAINYMRISQERDRTHNGNAMNRPMIQFSCWAKSYATVKDLAELLIAKLDNFSNYLKGGKVTIFHRNDRDLYEPDTGYYHVPIEFEIYEEN